MKDIKSSICLLIFEFLGLNTWRVVGGYEMWSERIAIGIYVFFITGVVESFPLLMSHISICIHIFKFFSVNGLPGHFITCFPFSCGNKAPRIIRNASQRIPRVSVLTSEYLSAARGLKSCSLKSFSVNQEECSTIPGKSHLGHQPRQHQERLFMHDTPDRKIPGKGVSRLLNL